MLHTPRTQLVSMLLFPRGSSLNYIKAYCSGIFYQIKMYPLKPALNSTQIQLDEKLMNLTVEFSRVIPNYSSSNNFTSNQLWLSVLSRNKSIIYLLFTCLHDPSNPDVNYVLTLGILYFTLRRSL